MKKVLSVLLAVMFVFGIFAVNVHAVEPVISPEETIKIVSGVTKGKGTIYPPTAYYKPGEDVTFHIVPDEGYHIKQVWVNGKPVGPVSEYTFYNIQENDEIYVEFEPDEEPTSKQPVTKPDNKNTSPDTGLNLNTIVLCVLGTMCVGAVAAVIITKKHRKEEY